MSDSASPPRSFVADHLNAVPRSGIRDFFEIVSTRKDIISLSIGEPDFITPWHIREAAIYALDRGATSYTANLGLLELRQRIAAYMQETFGAAYDPASEILITVGVSEALDLALRAVLNPGDEVLYHEPCYVSYAPVVCFAHGVPVPVPTSHENGFRLTRAMLEKKVTPRTRVLMINYPNNPTGAALSREEAADIAAFARDHDLLLITDDIYSELTYDGDRPCVATEPGMRERTIVLSGFSKAWAMTGFRLGYACAPPELLEAMMKIHQYTMLCAPILSQKAAIAALHHGEADLIDMRESYRQRRNWLDHAFQEMRIPCVRPQGAFYAFPCIREFGLSSREFALRFLKEENVACVPGSAFGACGEGYLRCTFAADLEDIKEAMRRLGSFVKHLRA